MRLKRQAIATILAVGVLMAGGGVAQAAEPAAAGTAAAGTAAVETSTATTPEGEFTPELERYLDALGDDERAEFEATMLPAETTVSYGAQTPANAAAVASLSVASARGLAVSPRATGCWTARVNGSVKALAGNTLYTYYHVGYWCASGSTVTTARVQDRGGETSTPGWRWDGPIGGSAGVVGNQGRSYSQVRFILRVGFWDTQFPTPCLRVNGTSSGTATSSGSCGIY